MRNRIKASALVVAVLLAAGAGRASAAVVNFTVGGTFDDGTVLSGNLGIDNVAGTVVGANFTTSGPYNYTFLTPYLGSATTHTTIFVYPTSASPRGITPYLSLVLPETTLVGFMGSYVATTSRPTNDRIVTVLFVPNAQNPSLQTGSIAVAPLPSTAVGGTALLGAVGLFGGLRRRRANGTAVA